MLRDLLLLLLLLLLQSRDVVGSKLLTRDLTRPDHAKIIDPVNDPWPRDPVSSLVQRTVDMVTRGQREDCVDLFYFYNSQGRRVRHRATKYLPNVDRNLEDRHVGRNRKIARELSVCRLQFSLPFKSHVSGI